VEAAIPVDVVPGPSAVLGALVISGLPTDRFVFEGFLPRSGKARSARLRDLSSERRTAVLFESPRRVAATLADLLQAGGDRPVAVVRELTKLHQEVLRGTVSEILAHVGERDLKGEVVLVVGGVPADAGRDPSDAVRAARDLVRAGARKREAARRVAEASGVPAREIYRALAEGEVSSEG
jgi:16S rRNA (cytidine1402-2'-O)-methyltransferase